MIAVLLSQLWVQRLGWTLLHFLWQGTAIAVAYAMLRSLLARSLPAQGRYALACAALAAMAVAPLLTFLMIPSAAGTGAWTVSAAEWRGLLPVVVALWLLGVTAFSIRLLGGWRFTARLRSTAHPAPAEWRQTVERIAARVGATQPVRLLVSSLVDVPTVIGWLRPVILVPVEFFTGLSCEHITALLAHEMGHIRRYDYLASVMQSLVESALFYHPAVWWISGQIREERELCCDDLAVAATGDVLGYARALAELETRQPARLTPALAANGGSLVNRIRRLIEPAQAIANNLPGPGAAWAMTLLWLAGMGVAAIHGAQTRPQPAANIAPVPAPRGANLSSPLAALAGTARNTLLYDPLLATRPRTINQHPVFVPRNAAAAELKPKDPGAAPALSLKTEFELPALEATAAALPVPAPASSLEAAPTPAFRADTKLVLVDVVAGGKRAAGSKLTQGDFRLLDNGKPQTIALFSANPPDAPAPAALAPGAFSNRLEPDGATPGNATVLLIDQRNTPQPDQAFAIQRITRFLKTARIRASKGRIGVYSFLPDGSLLVVQELTDDDERLSEAAASLKARLPAYPGGSAEPGRNVLETSDVLEAVARHLAEVPGRKNLIWVSAGFPAAAAETGLESTARVLTDANLALYAVDARGLAGSLSGATAISNAEFRGSPAPFPFAGAPGLTDLSPNADAIGRLADLTGGMAFYNDNGIEDSIQRALDDAALTYTLGFYPSQEEQDATWHKLTVKVSEPGIKVRYRERYFVPGARPDDDHRLLPALLKAPLEATQLQLVAQTAPDRQRAGFSQVRVSIDLHHVHLESQNNVWVGAVDVSYQLKGAHFAQIVGGKIRIAKDQLAEALKTGVSFTGSVDAGSGDAELRIVAQDRATGAAGSLTIPLSR